MHLPHDDMCQIPLQHFHYVVFRKEAHVKKLEVQEKKGRRTLSRTYFHCIQG